ncbi:MAG: tyrosine--tRNA ligase [Patescibacteria group bacterium]
MTKPKDSVIRDLLSRGVENVIDATSLRYKLQSGRPLRIKHGVDPTTKDLHLGYGVVYQKLRAFQELGHTVIFLVGDFTGRFGDPTDKVQTRLLRGQADVEVAAQSYIKQIGRVLDMSKTEIRRNSEWYDKMSAEELLRLQSKFTVARLLERDMFQRRIKENKEIGYHEPVYPILQAYDSVMLQSDVTVIGTDQTFNELQARTLQRDAGQEPQDIIAMKLLVGTDGHRKMSQSLGNYIGLTEAPAEMYGKVMSIPDEIIPHYFELATRMPLSKIELIKKQLKAGVNPRDLKAKLASEIVALYYDAKAAKEAALEFDHVFKDRQAPTEVPAITVKVKKISLPDLLVQAKTAASKGEARRLLKQRGVKADGVVLTDWKNPWPVKTGTVFQVGKRRFFKIG